MQMSVYSQLICKWLNRSSANPEAISNMLAQRTGCMGYPGFIGGQDTQMSLEYPKLKQLDNTYTGRHCAQRTQE